MGKTVHLSFEYIVCLFFLTGTLLASQSTHASNEDIHIAGFASFIYGKTFTQAEEGKLDRLDSEGEYREFNTLGLRMDVVNDDHFEKLSFTTQLIAEGINDYNADFDWIYVGYNITTQWKLKVGKTRTPLYMYSDYTNVSYALPWLSPPSILYAGDAYKSLEGLNLSHRAELNNWTSFLQLFYGTTKAEQQTDLEQDSMIEVGFNNFYGFAWDLEFNGFQMRMAHGNGDISLSKLEQLDQLIDSLAGLGDSINGLNLAPTIENIQLQNDNIRYYTIGSALEWQQFFASAEITHSVLGSNGLLAGDDAWYVMAGTHLPANWRINLTYGEGRRGKDSSGLTSFNKATAPFNDGTSPLSQGINALGSGIEILTQAQKLEATEAILSGRWDFHPSAALTLEYLERTERSFTGKRKPTAFKIGLAMVF